MHAAARPRPDPRMFLKDFDTPAERRWSELVPPRTALTFAAIWDEEEGMVTFSGAHLFDSETAEKGRKDRLTNDSPSDVAFGDGESQVLTINDRFAITANGSSPACPGYALPSAGVDSLAFARDAMIDTETVMDSRSCLTPGGLRVPPGIHYAPDSPAVASSMALASLANIPFRRTLMNNPFHRFSRDSRTKRPDLRVQTDEEEEDRVRDCDGYGYANSARSDVTDEGFFEDRRLTTGSFGTAPVLVEVNLSSAFSVTTTSTSRYVEVDHPSQAEAYSYEQRSQRTQLQRQSQQPLVEKAASINESAWSTLRDAERNICFNVPLEIGRRLKKQRSPPQSPSPPADPAEVLARECYNHLPSPRSRSAADSSDISTWSGTHGRRGCVPNIPNIPRPLTPKGSLKRGKALLNRVVPCKRPEGIDDRWVYVEVEHKVKQRVCAVCV